MKTFAPLKTERNPAVTVVDILKKMVSEHLVNAVLVAARTPYSLLPMPTLFTDPAKMQAADPLAPASPFNAARQAAALLRYESPKRIALVLRPCEIRALVELVKLKQCTLDNVVLMGIECLGRMENDLFLEKAAEDADLTANFYRNPALQDLVCRTCKACEHFQPKGVDLTFCVIGLPVAEQMGLAASTDAGVEIMAALGMQAVNAPAERDTRAAALHEQRLQTRAALFQRTAELTDNIEKFQNYFANCLNCYNCRVACPVCYCKECVFVTDIFAHDPEVLLRRAQKKGMVKLPADTTMFHLTRLAHMAHACVGCGHCSSVCPSNIGVADVFRSTAAVVQNLYAYEAGRDVNEPIPLLVFDEGQNNTSQQN